MSDTKNTVNSEAKRYEVVRAKGELKLEAGWDGAGWNQIKPLQVELYMGDKPEHMPRTEAKVAYDDKAIYVAFRVQDRYVRAVAVKNHDMVCQDSCVEFFFTPGKDIAIGYFNLEMNCSGTILLYHQFSRNSEGRKVVTDEDCAKIRVHAQMPKRIDPEITEPVTWGVNFSIPFEMMEKYCKVVRPAPGVEWRANFYKCADKTSYPHWLTWSKVGQFKPDFHLPQFFGTLKFV